MPAMMGAAIEPNAGAGGASNRLGRERGRGWGV